MTEEFYDHHLSSDPTTTVLRHTLQYLLHFTHPLPMYAQNSFRKRTPQNYVPTSVLSNVHIMSLSRIYWISKSFTISLSHVEPLINKKILYRTRQYMHLLTLTYLYVFVPKGLTQICKSTLSHVSQYKPFIPNGLYNIKKCHIITSKKPISHYFSLFN